MDALPLHDYIVDRDLSGTAITLLVDQSGSMKGDRILWAAAGVSRLADLLLAQGVTVEILGFSTAGWRGGHAREKWIALGKPKRPGRLCALLHSIYKEADASALENDDLRVMLNPNILRENIDGESIEWAARRLLRRQEAEKLLVVFSDGAPADDSTFMENGEAYLSRHLEKILLQTEKEGKIKIGAVNLDPEFESHYKVSVAAGSADEVVQKALELIANLASLNCEHDQNVDR
jgi:cobaltochelatase CobT